MYQIVEAAADVRQYNAEIDNCNVNGARGM
jgi:hypothetical protein